MFLVTHNKNGWSNTLPNKKVNGNIFIIKE